MSLFKLRATYISEAGEIVAVQTHRPRTEYQARVLWNRLVVARLVRSDWWNIEQHDAPELEQGARLLRYVEQPKMRRPTGHPKRRIPGGRRREPLAVAAKKRHSRNGAQIESPSASPTSAEIIQRAPGEQPALIATPAAPKKGAATKPRAPSRSRSRRKLESW